MRLHPISFLAGVIAGSFGLVLYSTVFLARGWHEWTFPSDLDIRTETSFEIPEDPRMWIDLAPLPN